MFNESQFKKKISCSDLLPLSKMLEVVYIAMTGGLNLWFIMSTFCKLTIQHYSFVNSGNVPLLGSINSGV